MKKQMELRRVARKRRKIKRVSETQSLKMRDVT